MRKKYKLLLLDPPWEYDDKQGNDPARGGITYPVLSMKDLHDLPLSTIAEDNAALVVWATYPKLMDRNPSIIDCIYSWGFKPATVLFTWIKLRPKGIIINEGSDPYWEEDKVDANCYEHIKTSDLYSGLGRYTNSNAEIAIIARRGKMLERVNKNVKQLIFAPIRKHSEKPREQYERLDALFGDVPRIELFARKQNPPPEGWDCTGLDYDGIDIREYLSVKGE